jgi:hypothetical protein
VARKLIVELLLDPRQYERGLQSANTSAKKFNREMETAGRGALSGTGIFRSMGRSLAFASGGFLAFGSATKFLTDSIDAARNAAVAQRQLAAQMKAGGESFGQNRKRIEEAALAYGRFGFTNEQVTQSLTVLDRGTGNINKSLKLEMLTADIARAKNMDLADAANVVAKVFGHQETALRRAVPGLEKNAHGWDLIREAQQKMAGQAAAGTTVSERFAATLHNTEEIIGTALLPVLNKYLTQLSKWLDQMNRSGKLQKDVNTFMKNATPIVSDLAGAVKGLADAYGTLNDVLRKLPGQKGQTLFGFLYQSLKSEIFPLGTPNEVLRKLGLMSGAQGGPVRPPPGLQGPLPVSQLPPGLQGPLTGGDGAPARRRGPPMSLRYQWFDATVARQLDRVQDLSLRKQLAQLAVIAQEVRARISITTDATRRLTLQDKLVQILRDERSVQTQITDQIKQQTQALQARADAIKQAALSRLDIRQQAITNKQQLQDALDALRVAQRIGGPEGVKLAQRQVQAARFAIERANLEAMNFGVRNIGGGMQAVTVGQQITINVHGTDNPGEVARQVVAIIQRRSRHGSSQSRGPTSTAAAGVGPH